MNPAANLISIVPSEIDPRAAYRLLISVVYPARSAGPARSGLMAR